MQMGNRWARSKTLLRVRPKASPRMPYYPVLKSRHEIVALDRLNFATNWRIGLGL